MSMRHCVGLIINPMAGRDIRRLVAAASLQSGPEKALVGKRIMAGIRAVSGVEVLVPQDQHGFFEWLKDEVARDMTIRVVPRTLGEDDSTSLWVKMLVDAGAEALVVVGGDGTQRNVAQASPSVPVLPIAGGTNNVACYLGDQTAAGYAVARYLVDRRDPLDVGFMAKLLHVELPGGREELALVDVALTRQNYTGAMAIWDSLDVYELILAMADGVRPGLSNVGGYLDPVHPLDDWALRLTMRDGGRKAPAVLAPGLMAWFSVERQARVALEEVVTLTASGQGSSLALDGERTVVLQKGQAAQVRLRRDGPYMLDPARILRPQK